MLSVHQEGTNINGKKKKKTALKQEFIERKNALCTVNVNIINFKQLILPRLFGTAQFNFITYIVTTDYTK